MSARAPAAAAPATTAEETAPLAYLGCSIWLANGMDMETLAVIPPVTSAGKIVPLASSDWRVAGWVDSMLLVILPMS